MVEESRLGVFDCNEGGDQKAALVEESKLAVFDCGEGENKKAALVVENRIAEFGCRGESGRRRPSWQRRVG